MKKILLIVLIACLNQVNAQVCFYSPTTYSTDANPWGICKGDFNEDGKLDLATSNSGTNDVSIFLGTGTGGVGTAVNFTVSNEPISIYPADFNNDGHADLVTCNFTTNKINVLLGTGTGSFGSATTYTTGTNTTPYHATSGDYNGDGNADIAVSDHYAGGKVSVFIGNGTGSFSAPTSYSINAGTSSSSGIVSADVTGDGKIDLIVATYIDVVVFPGNGNGTFATAITYTTDANAQTNELVCNDFNADGYLDIVTTNLNSNSLSIFLGNGSGSFGTVTNIPLGTYPFGICSADFNSDGKLDIAVSTNSNNNLDVLLGDGAGNFGTAFVFPLSSTNTRDCVAGDFNSDGKPDVAIAGFTNPFMSVFLNSLPSPVTITGNTTICAGKSTILTASGTDAFTWSANAGNATTNTVSVSPGTTTTYTVSGNNTGCTVLATKTITVNVNALPIVVINPSTSATVCSESSITLSATGANTYTWTGGISNGVTFFPTASQTYTVTGTDLHGCTNTASFSLFQPTPISTSIFAQTNVSGCYGQNNGSTALSTSGGYGSLTYSWAPSGGTASSASNLTGGTYTCTITDALSCIKTQTVIITQPAAITTIVSAQANLSCYGANNGAATVSASGGTGTLNYNWSPSGGATNSVSNLASGSYVCTVTDANSCTKTQTVSITQPAAITSSIVSQNNVNCAGASNGAATIIASGGTGTLNYNWVPSGGTSVTAANLVVGSYSCVITDSNNCSHSQPVVIVQNVLSAPDICLVTTDSASGYNYNIIYWDKTGYTHIDSFIVYRYDVTAAGYLRIGAVSNDSLSIFTDTVRSVGGGSTHNGGDPNATSWKYKLAILDTCGNISPQSPYHQTEFLQSLGGGNFSISQYVIETGQANPISGYELYRDNLGNNNYQPLIAISGTSATDNMYVSYPNANYRVDILGFSCNPTYRLSGNNSTDAAKVKSHSNTNNNRGETTSLKQMSDNNLLSVYPNPNNGNFTIETKGNVQCMMYDINGKEVLSQTINGKAVIDASSLTEGVYNLSMISNRGVINKRVVIVK